MSITTEETDFCRLCRCVLDLNGGIYRDILVKKLSIAQCPAHADAIRNLRPEQLRIAHNVPNKGNYNECDITLMYSLLRNNCRNVPQPSNGWGKPPNGITLSDDIERIRVLRNVVYGHAVTASISAAEFLQHIQTITLICQRMDTVHSNDIANSAGLSYCQQLHLILTCSMDSAMKDNYLKDIKVLCNREQEIESKLNELLEGQNNTRAAIHEHVADINEQVACGLLSVKQRVAKVQEEVHVIQTDIGELKIQKISSTDDSQTADHKKEQRLQDYSMATIEQHRQNVYIKRIKLERACEDILDSYRQAMCIIAGKSGLGKRRISIELLSKWQNRQFQSYMIEKPEQLLVIPISKPCILDIDISFSRKQDIEEYLRNLDRFLQSQPVKVVVRTDNENVEFVQEELSKCKVFPVKAKIIQMSDWKLNMSEKREMVIQYQQKYKSNTQRWSQSAVNGGLTLDDIETISTSNLICAFPRACKRFFTEENSFRLGPHFFMCAHDFEKEIDNLVRKQGIHNICCYLILCCVLFERVITFDIVKHVATSMRFDQVPDRIRIYDSEKRLLNDEYIKKGDNGPDHVYELAHPSLYDAILLSVAKYYPETLLTHASRRMVFNHVISCNYPKKPSNICCRIPVDCYDQFAERLLEANEDALTHRTLIDQEFVSVLLHKMYVKYKWASKTPMDKLTLRYVFLTACKTQSLLVLMTEMLCRLQADEESNCALLREGLFQCVRLNDKERVKEFRVVSQGIREEALILAVEINSPDMISALIDDLDSVHIEIFYKSIKFGFKECVKRIVDRIKLDTQTYIEGLKLTVSLEKTDVLQYLVEVIDVNRFHHEVHISDILGSGMHAHNTYVFRLLAFLFHEFLSKPSNTENVFFSLVKVGHVEGLKCLMELNCSTISNSALESAFVQAFHDHQAEMFYVLCQQYNMSGVSDEVVFDTAKRAVETHAIQFFIALVEVLKTRTQNSMKIEELFLLASIQKDTMFVDALYQLSLPLLVLRKAILLTIASGEIQNAKHIIAKFDNQKLFDLQIFSQELFISLCEQNDVKCLLNFITVFDKTQVLHDTLIQGTMLSVGSDNTHTLEFLLQEFERPWVSNDILQTLILEISKSEKCSAEKLRLLLLYADDVDIKPQTKEDFVLECMSSNNIDTIKVCFEHWQDLTLLTPKMEEAIMIAINSKNAEILNVLAETAATTGETSIQEYIVMNAIHTGDQAFIDNILSWAAKETK